MENDDNESIVIMLVQQYAARFGITFSSRAMEVETTKQKAVQLMSEALAGRRGAVTDEDLGL
ncbi:MAG: hypothetical protein LBV44_09215 [Methylobacillus sp.]|jgi:hypothetical protein|nr:hypothetical protein [Methylobacillus sp.]